MTDALLASLSFAGFALLLLAMPRHHQDWLARKIAPATSRRLRRAGFAVLTSSFIIAGAGHGWVYGSVCWLGWLTVAAGCIVAANTNRERIQRWMQGRRS